MKNKNITREIKTEYQLDWNDDYIEELKKTDNIIKNFIDNTEEEEKISENSIHPSELGDFEVLSPSHIQQGIGFNANGSYTPSTVQELFENKNTLNDIVICSDSIIYKNNLDNFIPISNIQQNKKIDKFTKFLEEDDFDIENVKTTESIDIIIDSFKTNVKISKSDFKPKSFIEDLKRKKEKKITPATLNAWSGSNFMK